MPIIVTSYWKVREMAKKDKKTKAVACKVCAHKHRIEIETALVIHSKTSRAVEKMIKDHHWEPVSYVTLLKHMQEHVDPKRELVLAYLEDKRRIIEAQDDLIDIGDDPEIDEQAIMLNSLRHLDASIIESSVLIQQASKAMREQLALRVETIDEAKTGKTAKASRIVGVDRQPSDKKKAYVPLQGVLVQLYKAAAEELRQTTKTKIEILGIDADGRQAKSMETLVDLVMADHQRKINE